MRSRNAPTTSEEDTFLRSRSTATWLIGRKANRFLSIIWTHMQLTQPEGRPACFAYLRYAELVTGFSRRLPSPDPRAPKSRQTGKVVPTAKAVLHSANNCTRETWHFFCTPSSRVRDGVALLAIDNR